MSISFLSRHGKTKEPCCSEQRNLAELSTTYPGLMCLMSAWSAADVLWVRKSRTRLDVFLWHFQGHFCCSVVWGETRSEWERWRAWWSNRELKQQRKLVDRRLQWPEANVVIIHTLLMPGSRHFHQPHKYYYLNLLVRFLSGSSFVY